MFNETTTVGSMQHQPVVLEEERNNLKRSTTSNLCDRQTYELVGSGEDRGLINMQTPGLNNWQTLNVKRGSLLPFKNPQLGIASQGKPTLLFKTEQIEYWIQFMLSLHI